jgi:hypothetical protein
VLASKRSKNTTIGHKCGHKNKARFIGIFTPPGVEPYIAFGCEKTGQIIYRIKVNKFSDFGRSISTKEDPSQCSIRFTDPFL